MGQISKRSPLDRLGKLCVEGQQVATYLFQVPDDASQWDRLREIVDAILAEVANTRRREVPKIAREMQEALDGELSTAVAEQLLSAFDRLVALWKSARSGMF